MDQAQENDRNDAIVASSFEGSVHISEDVMVELTRKTIQGIPNIQTTNTGIASKFGLGRKAGEGVRVAVEEGKTPSISVDAYVLVKYGQRIPDLAWDVQEKIKANLERYTGYSVSSVNINVQGIYTDEPIVLEGLKDPEPPASEPAEGSEGDDAVKGEEGPIKSQ